MEYDHNWQANNNSRKYLDDLIERDKPKKPRITDIVEGDIHGSCTICGRRVHLFKSDQICGTEWFFCPHCGNRLGWSE